MNCIQVCNFEISPYQLTTYLFFKPYPINQEKTFALFFLHRRIVAFASSLQLHLCNCVVLAISFPLWLQHLCGCRLCNCVFQVAACSVQLRSLYGFIFFVAAPLLLHRLCSCSFMRRCLFCCVLLYNLC